MDTLITPVFDGVTCSSDFDRIVRLGQLIPQFGEDINNPQTLNMLADIHGLPYSETFQELAAYSKMKPDDLPLNEYVNDRKFTMAAAAYAGYEDYVYIMLKAGADNFNETMVAAIYGGHNCIVNHMIQLNTTHGKKCLSETIRSVEAY